MIRVEDYRRKAAELMRLAQRASTAENKSRLMKLAEGWLDLADHRVDLARRTRTRQSGQVTNDERDHRSDGS